MAQQEAEPYPSAALIAALIAVLVVIVFATDVSARPRRDTRNTVAIFPLPKQLVNCGRKNYTHDDNVVKLSATIFLQPVRNRLNLQIIILCTKKTTLVLFEIGGRSSAAAAEQRDGPVSANRSV